MRVMRAIVVVVVVMIDECVRRVVACRSAIDMAHMKPKNQRHNNKRQRRFDRFTSTRQAALRQSQRRLTLCWITKNKIGETTKPNGNDDCAICTVTTIDPGTERLSLRFASVQNNAKKTHHLVVPR